MRRRRTDSITVRRRSIATRSVKTFGSLTSVKNRSIVCIMMSEAPAAICSRGRVKASVGFIKAKTGRLSGEFSPTFCPVSSFVSTAESLVSLPAAGMVSTDATGIVRVSSAFFVQISQMSTSGFAMPWATAFAESITLPPPMARMKFTSAVSPSRIASRTNATRGFGCTPPITRNASPAEVRFISIRESSPERSALPPPWRMSTRRAPAARSFAGTASSAPRPKMISVGQ